MARPQVVTDMQIWMIQAGLTDITLAERLNKVLGEMPGRHTINERHIGRWRKGLALPRYPELYAALEQVSGGKVTANSFVHGRRPPDGDSG